MNKNTIDISLSQKFNLFNITFEYCLELISLILLFVLIENVGRYFNIYLNEIFLLIIIVYSTTKSKKFLGISDLIAFNYLMIYLVYIGFLYLNR